MSDGRSGSRTVRTLQKHLQPYMDPRGSKNQGMAKKKGTSGSDTENIHANSPQIIRVLSSEGPNISLLLIFKYCICSIT